MKEKVQGSWRWCVRLLARWKIGRYPVRVVIWYAATFAMGWVGCYVTMWVLPDSTTAAIAGFLAGAALAPIGWLWTAVLLHEVDQERHNNELAALDDINERFAQLDKHYRESILKRWRVSDEGEETHVD